MTATPGAGTGGTSPAVITATTTIMDGLVIRWRHVPNGDAVVSASRNHVMIHGDVILTGKLKQWIADAERARDLIRDGHLNAARAFATHKYAGTSGRELVPLYPAESTL